MIHKFGATNAVINLSVASCLMMLLAACIANPVALEPQNRSLDARQARLHFIRQPSAIAGLLTYPTVDIKVDGKPVGTLTTGSFVIADRPPGTHTISVAGNRFDTVGFETEIQVQAGASYYFEIGPIVRINNDLLMQEAMVSGRPLTGRYNDHSGFMFYSLDVTTGAASVASLNGKK
jgi:hypothetical protein